MSTTRAFASVARLCIRSVAQARPYSSSPAALRAAPLSATSPPDFHNPPHPPFPDDVPTHPLIIIDYERIRAWDAAEVDQLWKAATTIGFWYLKNHGTDAEVDRVFAMGDAFMRLPLEEKMKYEQGDEGNSFGYKYAGANATNAAGARDTIEFLNIAQDHVPLDTTSHHTSPSTSRPFPSTSPPFPSTPSPSHHTPFHTHHTSFHTHYPPPVSLPLVTSFIRHSREINLTLMRALGERLGLGAAIGVRNSVGVLEAGRPVGVLEAQNAVDVLEAQNAVDALDARPTTDVLSALHAADLPSGSELRFTKNAIPTDPEEALRKGIGAHTDFGSLSLVHNRLGGLQVLVPDSQEWQYVKPLPAHAVCNIGDALAILSGGILRSNLHRVVPPPPPQRHLARTSLVFFTRPNRDVVLRALVGESRQIAEAVEGRREKGEDVEPYLGTQTAGEWFARRIRGWRIRNREGPQTWIASRGTEGRSEEEIPDEGMAQRR
ncbi:hypothetical protein EV715DRAFT_292833 [Schizophyllum commune]